MSSEHRSELEDYLKTRTPSKDEFFKEFTVSQHYQNKKKYLITTKMYNDPKIAEREAELKKKRKAIKDDCFVNLADYTFEIKKNLCSTNYIVRSFYEFPQRSLKREIFNRRKNSKVSKFSTEEMTHLFYNILDAGKKLQEKGKTHGDISPFSIFHTNEGKFKLAPYPEEHMTPLKIQQQKSIKGEPMYVSSQMLFAAKKRKTKADLDPYKSDIFSLGLVLLEAGLLKNVSNIYAGSTINETVLDQYVGEFEGQYCDNPLLFSSLQRMLELKEDDRADFVGLDSVIPPYPEICQYFYDLQHGLIDSNEGGEDMDPQFGGQGMGEPMGDQFGYQDQGQFQQDYDEFGNPIQGYNNQADFDPNTQWEGQDPANVNVNAGPNGQFGYNDPGYDNQYNNMPNQGNDGFENKQFDNGGYDQNNFNDQYPPQQGGYNDQNPQGGYNDQYDQNPQGGYNDQYDQNPQGGYNDQYDQNPQGGYNDQYDQNPQQERFINQNPQQGFNDQNGQGDLYGNDPNGQQYNDQYGGQYDQNPQQGFNGMEPQTNPQDQFNQNGQYGVQNDQYGGQHNNINQDFNQGPAPGQFQKKAQANYQNQGYNEPQPPAPQEDEDPYGQTNDEYDDFFNQNPPQQQYNQNETVQKKSNNSYSYGGSTTAPSNTLSNQTPSYTQSHSNYQAPSTTYKPPQTTYQAPTTTYQAPTTTYQAPTTTYQAPTTTYKPATTYQTPTTTYKPATTYQTPGTTSYSAPSQSGGDIVERNGKKYRQIKETKQEMVNGQMVTKVILKLTPL